MTATTAPILVIGATGKIGSRIVTRLESAGIPVRAASRRTSPAFDWDDARTWAPALAGTKVAFVAYVPDLAEEGAPERIALLTETAKAAGVERMVLLSGRGERNAMRAEQTLVQSGLDYTVVRASWFNQNFSEGHLASSILSGVLAMPGGDVREPFVDADDVAEVATAALLDTRHSGQVYEVTGPRLLSFTEAAAEIAAASGHPIQHVRITLDELHAALLPEAGLRYANLLRNLCEEVLDGRNESTVDGVQRALGRPARDFADYVRDTAAAGFWRAAAA